MKSSVVRRSHEKHRARKCAMRDSHSRSETHNARSASHTDRPAWGAQPYTPISCTDAAETLLATSCPNCSCETPDPLPFQSNPLRQRGPHRPRSSAFELRVVQLLLTSLVVPFAIMQTSSNELCPLCLLHSTCWYVDIQIAGWTVGSETANMPLVLKAPILVRKSTESPMH